MIRNSKVTVTYSKYRMIPDELQGHDTSDEDEDEYFTQDDARIELPTKLRESFIIFGVGAKYGLRCMYFVARNFVDSSTPGGTGTTSRRRRRRWATCPRSASRRSVTRW